MTPPNGPAMPDRPGHATRAEIRSQPEVWARTLERLRGQESPLRAGQRSRALLVTGCGSTHYLAMWAARVAQRALDVHVTAAPASELLLHADAWIDATDTPTLLAISRSGETTETVDAVAAFRRRARGRVLVVTCEPDSTLAQAADVVVAAPDARERSVVQTRSFTSMALATAWMVHGDPDRAITDGLPQETSDLLERWAAPMAELAADDRIRRFFFLGSDSRYGFACEAMLKIKEMALEHAEAYHFHEVRHGPWSLIDGETLVVGLLGPDGAPTERRVLDDARALGARILAVGVEAATDVADVVPVPATITGPWRDLLLLPVLQTLGMERAVHRGLDPDAPRNLDAVVRLEP
jgi:glutamine---fructose-6-phosphate transaminase (isomerizing)